MVTRISFLALFLSFNLQAGQVQVRPKPVQDVLANPGMGWQTFMRFATEDKNLAGLPSRSAYFRFYWREVEPVEGKIDFAKFDDLLQRAGRARQKLAFRIMCTGSSQYMDVPGWLKEQGCGGTEFSFEGRPHWVPDFSDAKFQAAHYRLIRELGRRYDGHPDLDLVDIGSVGLWGEWHMSGTKAANTGKAVPLPSEGIQMAIVDEWLRAFPQSSKVVLIGSAEGMSRTVPDRLGWRADCLGDMGGFSKNWNHMENFYLQQIEKTAAKEAWKTGPVAFESCWDMRKWKESGWDIRGIFDYALNCHVSYVNNKSAPLPEGTREEVERLLKRMGYRLVLRLAEYNSVSRAGAVFELKTAWENAGVAPPYRDYRLALELMREETPGKVLPSGESIQGWLPGSHEKMISLRVPAEMEPGKYSLFLGLVHPVTRKAEVRLAVDLPEREGWYALGTLELTR